MRRKSERATASKKGKASPEKKLEKVKRTRSRRKKQSTSSENESADDASPARVEAIVETEESKPPKTPVKEESPEEAQDQVWKVKTAEGGNVGEIQKLKICLTRPPSTPERAERSPRSKRKHSRATSSSDTTSVEAPEEKEKRKSRRFKRSHRESKDEPDKNLDSQEEEMETESISQPNPKEAVTQSENVKKTEDTSETTISTSNQSNDSGNVQSSEDTSKQDDGKQGKVSDADTTVVSPKVEVVSSESAAPEPESSTQSQEVQETATESKEEHKDENKGKESESKNQDNSDKQGQQTQKDSEEIQKGSEETQKGSEETQKGSEETQKGSEESQKDCKETQNDFKESHKDVQEDQNKKNDITKEKTSSKEMTEKTSPERRRSTSVDKSEILELHPEENKCDSDIEMEKPKSDDTEVKAASHKDKVSKTEEKVPKQEPKNDNHKDTNVTGVLESSYKDKRERNVSTDLYSEQDIKRKSVDHSQNNKMQRSDSIQSNEEPLPNGQPTPIVVSRKRRWGSRPSKITTQKSITISTDVLKDIIPDVKPVEFDEVIEERKSKREVNEKIELPVLPKIIIDNTENIDRNVEHRKDKDDKDKDVVKPRDSQLAANRKISIVQDSESIIARPPSPPRHKQSCVLYITNLVRPFTLPQLKNLLQRTGRIVENGFWIDKIKSKCFVVYETEDQAVETRHALHGVTWPVSNPKTLQVDFSTQEAFEKTKVAEENETAPVSTIPGTVEDWLREQDQKRERGELEKPWERKLTREWDLGKNEKDQEKENIKRREDKERMLEKRRHRTPERSPEPARKFKKKEEEAPAKLLDDLFKKTKATPCIYWLPLSAETIAIKEEQRRQHMAEHERRMLEQQRRTHRRH